MATFGNNFYLVQSKARGGAATGSPAAVLTPNDIASANLVLWLDFTGLASNTTNSYGSVDVSNNITQVNNLKTGATDDFRASVNHPTFDDVSAPNSKNSARFQSGQKLIRNPATLTISAPYTGIMICKRFDTDARIYGLGESLGGNNYLPDWDSDGVIYFSAGSAYVYNSTAHDTTFDWNYLTFNATSNSAGDFWFNGAVDTTGATGEVQTMNFPDFGIALGNSSNGWVAEYILYNKTLDSTERTQIWSYITTKYSWP